jgi:signal transduction histidine kinase
MSIRIKLVLLNTLVVLIGLLVGIELIVFRTQKVFVDSIDRDLISLSRNLARPRPVGPGGGPGGGPGLGPRFDPGFGPRNGSENGPDERRPRFNNGDPLGGGDPQDRINPAEFPPELRNAPRRNALSTNDVQRPAFYNADGTPRFGQETRNLYPQGLKNPNLKQPQIVEIEFQDVPTRVVTTPILREGNLIGFVQMGHDLADFQRLKDTQQSTVLFLLPFMVGMAAIAGWFLANRALAPVEKVTEAAARINDAELSIRLKVRSNDEIGRLAATFNSMLERLEHAFKLQRENLEKQKQFVGDASHELRTPITRIQLSTSAALEQTATEEELREALTIADRESQKMGQMVEQLLTLARLEGTGNPDFEMIDLQPLLDEIVHQHSNRNPEVRLESGEALKVRGSQYEIGRAVINLIENARRHTPSDGTITVSTHAHGPWIDVIVSDTGSGIPSEHLPRIIERFYRVDTSRSRKDGGTGLGLSIVKAIMVRHEGDLFIESRVDEGTRVVLRFPCPS